MAEPLGHAATVPIMNNPTDLRRPGTAATAVAAVLALITGCGTAAPASGHAVPAPATAAVCPVPAGQPEGEKNGDGLLHTDAPRAVDLFPALADAESVHWMAGTLGHDDGGRGVPGPSVYWFDAVVTMPPDRISALVTTYSPVPTTDRPDLTAALRCKLPAGPLLGGEALDRALTPADWTVRAYLSPDTGQLVITAIDS